MGEIRDDRWTPDAVTQPPSAHPLSGLDEACLALDSARAPMNVIGTLVLDPSTAPGGYSRERVIERIRGRVSTIPPMRRRLRELPLGLAPPVWVDDPDFDLEQHVHAVRLPESRGDAALPEFVAEVAGQRLDRSRPLWDIYVVEALPGGRAALVMVMHHAAADGIAGAQILGRLLDLSPEAPPEAEAEAAPEPCPLPSDLALLRDAAWRSVEQPARLGGWLVDGVKAVAQRALGSDTLPMDAALPFKAARTRISGGLSTRRTVAYSRARRRDLEFVRSTLGGSLNDVVLTACARSLRHYLLSIGERPRGPLLASVPVSVRRPEQADDYGNRISIMFARLPVHLEDPLEQLWAVRAETRQSKQLHAALGGETLGRVCEFLPSSWVPGALRVYEDAGLTNLHPPIHNLVMSNVPGPPIPLYAAGARVEALHPHGPLTLGAALNLTVMSYVDSVDFGLLACTERVPHAGDIATGFTAAVGELVKLGLEESPDRPAEGASAVA